MIEITILTNDTGPLTKQISLGTDGKLVSKAGGNMVRGKARRVKIDGLPGLAKLIEGLTSNQALTLGALRSDLPDEIDIVTYDEVKAKANRGGGAIARIAKNFCYHSGQPALTLLDFDTKGITPEVARKIADLGGFWPAMVSVLPTLAGAAHLIRNSTSAGLSRSDTGEEFPGSGGLHVYIIISDGSDAKRFLKTIHERCWLAGFGWMMIDVAGRLWERSLVDRTVWAPERLVFEGPTIIKPPLMQTNRWPVVVPGRRS